LQQQQHGPSAAHQEPQQQQQPGPSAAHQQPNFQRRYKTKFQERRSREAEARRAWQHALRDGQSRSEAAAAFALVNNGIEPDPVAAAAAAAAAEAMGSCSPVEPQPQLLKVPTRYQQPTTRQQLDSIQGKLEDIQGQLLQLQQKVDLLLQLQQQQQQQQQPLWVAIPVQQQQQQQQDGDMQQGWLQLPPVLPWSTPRDRE
jgi:hypothetical protein